MLMRIRANLADVKNFGPRVLARHIGRRRIHLGGVGQVTLRPGQSDLLCMRQVFAGREYDLSTIPAVQARVDAAYRRILADGGVPVIIDGGANIGAASIWFARLYPEAKILAVEPEEGNHAVLLENIRSWPNVMPVKAALGSEPGHAAVESEGLGWAARTVRSEDGLQIMTVDDCVRSVPAGRLFIVKVDIEGFEQDLFAGGTEWISDAAVLAIEPHDWMLPGQFTSRNFMRAVAAQDFELFILGENLIFVR